MNVYKFLLIRNLCTFFLLSASVQLFVIFTKCISDSLTPCLSLSCSTSVSLLLSTLAFLFYVHCIHLFVTFTLCISVTFNLWTSLLFALFVPPAALTVCSSLFTSSCALFCYFHHIHIFLIQSLCPPLCYAPVCTSHSNLLHLSLMFILFFLSLPLCASYTVPMYSCYSQYVYLSFNYVYFSVTYHVQVFFYLQ